jgi:NNP family nitrate/nitrite transporter-like MFS transporter
MRPWVMLAVATVGFAVNFWAWALLSPLGPKFKDVLHLSPFAQYLVVAVPVIVGALGRIPGRRVPAGTMVSRLAATVRLRVTWQVFTPSLVPLATIAFLAMAAALGAGSGAVFALVARLAPAEAVGSVTGVVGAVGGLGGFIPPLIMGLVYGQFHDYAAGLAALAVVAAAALVLAATGVRAALAARA